MSVISPWAERLLGALMAAPDRRDALLGDLAEEAHAIASHDGPLAARRWYWRQALSVVFHRLYAAVARRGPTPGARLPEPDEPRSGLLAAVGHNVRSAWKALRHQPAMGAAIVLVLAVGLAANAVIFAIGDAIVLRPFRFSGVDRAVVVASSGPERFFDRESVAPADFLEWRERTAGTFDAIAAVAWWDPALAGDGPPQQLAGFQVSPAFFDILSQRAVLGRTLLPADERQQTPGVVLSYAFWMRQFGGRADVLGHTLRLDGVTHQVVGVMPRDFTIPFGAEVWAPLAFTPEARAQRSRGHLMVLARLSAGVTPAQADSRMQAILSVQRTAYPDTHAKRPVSVRTFTAGFADPGAGPFVAIWQLAAVLLLLVACANVANLLLARNSEREREFSVRLALGASGARIAWQLLTEGLMLSTMATVLAVPLAWATLQATRAAFPPAIVRYVAGWAYLHVDAYTFLVTAVLAVSATMLFAVVPAWRAARQTVVTGLRQGGRLTQGAGRQRGRTLLACAQIALTLTLLTSAGLSLAALSRVTDGALGFEPAHVLTGQIALPLAAYATPDTRRQFAERVIARLATLPAVTAVAVTNVLPYSGSDASTRFWREDVPPREADARQVSVRRVTPGLLPLLHVPLRAGRMLRDDDRPGSVEVALVSEGFAAHTWPNGPAVGRRFRMTADGPLIMVVGVVGNVVQDWLIDPLRPVLYRPLAQDPPGNLTVVAHTVTDPSQIAADLRAAVQAEDPNQPVTEMRSFETLIADHTFGLRFAGQTLTVMAVVSLLLATIGIYSLMSFITSRRTREIGLRLALGATRWDVIALTGAQALRVTGVGLAVGLVLALGAGKLLERAMFGSVTADMPLAFGLALLLGIVSTAASYIPAHRAAATDPTITLRAD